MAALGYNLAFTILGRAGDTPFDSEAVPLGPVHGVGDGFGGFADSDRQDTSRERIECAGMPRFGSGSAADAFYNPG